MFLHLLMIFTAQNTSENLKQINSNPNRLHNYRINGKSAPPLYETVAVIKIHFVPAYYSGLSSASCLVDYKKRLMSLPAELRNRSAPLNGNA